VPNGNVGLGMQRILSSVAVDQCVIIDQVTEKKLALIA
jgi:hypothetical protein